MSNETAPLSAVRAEPVVSQPFGRLLTADEVLRAIAATDDDTCAACGTLWTMHRIRCEGSEVANAGIQPAERSEDRLE